MAEVGAEVEGRAEVEGLAEAEGRVAGEGRVEPAAEGAAEAGARLAEAAVARR